MDVAALADGSLHPDREAAVRARVAASPALAEAYARQLEAVNAIRAANAALTARERMPRYGWVEIACLVIGLVILAMLLVDMLIVR